MSHLITNVKCYRYEMGIALERISSIYFKVIEQVLECNIKYYNEHKLKWEKQIEEGLR